MTVDLKESDRILTMLTTELGKISVLAKGARRSKKRFMGGLDLFECAEFELTAPGPRSSLYLAHGMEHRISWLKLRADINKFNISSFCLEITNHFAPEQDQSGRELFHPLFLSLEAINRAETVRNALACAVWLTLKTLKMSGFDRLESNIETAIGLQEYWEKLIQLPTPPEDVSAETEKSFGSLITFVEHILERQLRTRAGAFSCYQRAIAQAG